MKSIPIYYMIYELHYFNCWEWGNAAAESKRREKNQEAEQEVLVWLPKRVLEHREG